MKSDLKRYQDLVDTSIRIIGENQSSTGGYLASPNFAVYNYSWFRDGAFIAHAMSIAGEKESARAFHKWAAENINKRAEKVRTLIERSKNRLEIDPEEHLHCRYSTDGNESEEDWTNFQLDGFGTWLWSLNEFKKTGEDLSPDAIKAVTILIPYLQTFWKSPSFDWWEESFGEIHISTIGCIAAGLEAVSSWHELSPELISIADNCAAEIRRYVLTEGVKDGHLTKWVGSSEVDGSLAALIAPLNWLRDSSIAEKTLTAISQQLGELGTHRHLKDVYFGGGPWPLLTAFLALGRASLGDRDFAEQALEWIANTADSDFQLPEQLPTDLLHPETRDEWIAKWGVPALPLLWSHAMFLILKAEVESESND